MSSLHELAEELNRVEDRMRKLSQELLAVTLAHSRQYVHVRKVELIELTRRQAQLLKLLS